VIGLDTNVLVRYLVQDDPEQSAAATTLVEGLSASEPGFVSLVTVVELSWVLRRAYGVDAGRCDQLIGGLLDAGELRVERASVLRTALSSHGRADFADAVVAELGRAAGCDHTVTFDRRAARDAGMSMVPS